MPSLTAQITFLLLLLVLVSLLLSQQGSTAGSSGWAKLVPIRELAEPRNYPPAYRQNQLNPVKRVAAKPALGPRHLVAGLLGRCFTAVVGHYEYRLCPFDNATQRDVSFQMLAIYHGVVGVFDGWRVSNGSFTAMSMPNGEPCHAAAAAAVAATPGVKRSTLVQFRCANATSLLAVYESPVCQYQMLLGTPLVCHRQAMLAYPSLAEIRPDLGHAWDAAYTMRQLGHINESSYATLVDNLLFRAQLLADTRGDSRELSPSAAGAGPTTSVVGGGGGGVVLQSHRQDHTVIADEYPGRPPIDYVAKQILTLQKQIEQRQQQQQQHNIARDAGLGRVHIVRPVEPRP